MSASDQNFFDAFAQALSQKELNSAPSIFTGGDKQTDAGFSVYRNNVRSSLSRALGEKFPVVKNLVGEAFFSYLAHEYFHEHPPSSPLIAHYGGALPVFLEDFEPARDYPYLADVARLEIAWLEAYHASDAAPMAATEVIAAAGDDFETLTTTLHPSLRLLSSPWPVASIWRHHQSNSEQEKLSVSGDENVLVARPSREVTVQTLAPGPYAAIAALHQGAAIAEALTAGSNADPQFNPQDFFEQLFQWNIITGVTAGQNKGPLR